MEVEGIKEDIREFIYLGYVVQKNGWQEAHVRKRVRRAALVMGQVWGDREEEIREGLGKEGVDVRLVWPVLDYEVEIWGWKERVKVEAIEERFMRWVLGMEGRKHVWEGCRDWGRQRQEVGRKKWRGL